MAQRRESAVAAVPQAPNAFDPILAERQQLGQEKIIARSQSLQLAAQIFHGTGDVDAAIAAALKLEAAIWASATETRRLRQEVAGLIPSGADTEH